MRIHRGQVICEHSGRAGEGSIEVLESPNDLGMKSTVHVVTGSLQVLNDGFVDHEKISGGVVGAALILGTGEF